MNTIRRIILTASLLIAIVAAPLILAGTTQVAFADTASEACAAIGAGTGCDENQAGGGVTVSTIVTTAVRILSFIVGIAAIIMIIIAGFKYVTSNGDSSKIGSAKNTLIYALVGIAVAVLAQVIVQFIVSRTVTP